MWSDLFVTMTSKFTLARCGSACLDHIYNGGACGVYGGARGVYGSACGVYGGSRGVVVIVVGNGHGDTI